MIVFSNPGTLDLRALKTFGLTSKSNQDNKIGRFGTGLKYAIATILRHGGKVSVHTNGNEYALGTSTEKFRNEDHTYVTLDGAPLPFTTALGRDWEPWMAFRELYANALDEGGLVAHVESANNQAEGTLIAVELDAFEAIYFTIEEHFITDEAPVWAGNGLEVYEGRSSFVFYRGIAVHKLKQPAAYRYNITSYLDLTEDRTAKYDFQVRWRLAEAAKACTCPAVAAAMTDARNKFECELDFADAEGEPSEVFIGAAAKNEGNCSPSARKVIAMHIPDEASGKYTAFSKSQPGGKELGTALALAGELGEDFSDLVWVLLEDVPIAGDYEIKEKTIFLSPSTFNNQDAMTLAVFKALDAVRGHDWAIKHLIQTTTSALCADKAGAM